MKKTTLLKSMLLLCALIVGSGSLWAEDYELYSGAITEGDYVIVYSDVAMKNTVTSDRFDYQSVTISEDKISNPAATIVWHIAASGTYWTIYNANVSKYAASTGAKNKGQLLASGTDDRSLWTVSGTSTYEFVNKQNTTNKVNANLRYNSGYGFACYATGTGGALSLYKKVESTDAATTVTINSTGITNTNKFFGTAAGTLTASVVVTSTSAAVPAASVTWSSSDEDVATVGASDGVVTLVGEGSTTITASYAGKSGEYKSSSAEYVLNVTNEDPNAVTLWSEDFSAYSEDDAPTGGTYSYVCEDGSTKTQIYNANNAGGTAPELLVNKNGGYFQATIPLENIKGNLKLKFKSNAYSVTVSTSTDGISIDGDYSFNALGEHTVTFTGVTTSKTSITIKFAAASSNNVRIDDIVLKGSKVAPVTIGTTGWSTYSNSDALDFANAEPSNPASDALEAYMITGFSGSALTKSDALDNVPGNTGLLLKGTAGETYNIPVLLSSSTSTTGNCLKPAVTATTVNAGTGDDVNYVLMKVGGSPVFQWIDTTPADLGAKKAYLTLVNGPKDTSAHGLWFDDETTGLNKVEMNNSKTNGVFYNLAGQCVTQPSKGLYIVNGKKVVVK